MNASLLVLAAGFGTRFKSGIKQLTPLGVSDELIIEYSIYDAMQAGFDHVIFVIRHDIEELFKSTIGDRISKIVKVSYCFQDDLIPEGLPEGFVRTKPWGTVHAVLAAKEDIFQPFAVINADDFYGRKSFGNLSAYLTENGRTASQQCMSGFILGNTISKNGTVTRGVCSTDEKGMLSSVTETYKIFAENDVITGEQNGVRKAIDPLSVVSMNMWGFTPDIIPMFEDTFKSFLGRTADLASDEYALPTAVDELIRTGRITVKMLPTDDVWYGITQTEDCAEVRQAFKDMTEKGIYPTPLFNK